MTFHYSNESGRPPGRFVRTVGLVVPGVARVQRTVPGIAATWRAANLAALDAGGPLWVALGDSLTLGVGAPAPDGGWVGQVRDRLAAAGRPLGVVNLAVSGATTREVAERQVPALAQLTGAGADIALVTLMVGSNDLMKPRERRELPGHLVELARTLPRGAVVATLPNPSPVAAAVNRALIRLADEHGLVVAELRDPRTTSWRGKLAADHFHPNEQGYAAIADVVADTLLGSRPAAGPSGR